MTARQSDRQTGKQTDCTTDRQRTDIPKHHTDRQRKTDKKKKDTQTDRKTVETKTESTLADNTMWIHLHTLVNTNKYM